MTEESGPKKPEYTVSCTPLGCLIWVTIILVIITIYRMLTI
jgi:hypothetical protein